MKQVKKVPLDPCEWCSGCGSSQQPDYLPAIGIVCGECQGTGFKYGPPADEYNDYLLEQAHQEFLKNSK